MNYKDIFGNGIWKRSLGKRVLSLVLASSMLAGSIPSNALQAFAGEALSLGASDDFSNNPLDSSNDSGGNALQLNWDGIYARKDQCGGRQGLG